MTGERERVGDPKGIGGCSRCPWQIETAGDSAAKRTLRAEHAAESAHWLCSVCTRSLPPSTPRVCESCLTATQGALAAIRDLWELLPQHRRTVRAQVYDSDRPGASDGRPLPGGDVLSLLGPGSVGNIPRRLTAGELQAGMSGEEHRVDNRPEDTPSVAQTLASWEDDWRHTRGEPAAVVDQGPVRWWVAGAVGPLPLADVLELEALRSGSIGATVRSAAGYLERHMRWAATSHDAFEEFAADLQDLRVWLEGVTGRSERPEVAEAECLDCAGDLVRLLDEKAGYADRWTCRRCHRDYDWTEYLRACAEHVDAGRRSLRGAGWGTPAQVSAAVGVPVETVRTWAKRGVVTSCCLVGSGALLVDYREAEERATRRRGAVA